VKEERTGAAEGIKACIDPKNALLVFPKGLV
jgi:hypothetical protein